jgi:chromosomal replication initiator protein
VIHDVVSVWGSPSPSSLGEAESASDRSGRQNGAANHADKNYADRSPTEFIFGPENALLQAALAAAGVSVSNEEANLSRDFVAESCNPLLLYGPSGIGKSHLLHSLVAAWREGRGEHRQNNPQDNRQDNRQDSRRKAILVTGADFARFHSAAMQADAMLEFRAKYRKVSLLAIEDLDGLAGRTAAQEELIGAIDALLEAKEAYAAGDTSPPVDAEALAHPDFAQGPASPHAALVVACLRGNPLETAGGEFLPGLVSRLCQGLSIPLALPSIATRRALVRLFARKWQAPLDDQAADLLAEELPLSAGALQSVVQRLQHAFLAEHSKGASKFASPREYERPLAEAVEASGAPIDAAFVASFLEKHAQVRQPSLRSIVVAVSKCYQMKAVDLKGAGRRQSVVMARSMAMYLARQLTDASLEDVGAHFGGRDHTTVMHACRKLARLVEEDAEVRRCYAQLRAELSAPSHTEAALS